MRIRVALVVLLSPVLGGCFGVPGLGYARLAAKVALGPERYEQIDPLARAKRQVREAILRPTPAGVAAPQMPPQPPTPP